MTTRKLRLSLLALAATATMATAALAPSTASAFGRFGGYHFGGRVLGLRVGGFNHFRFGWGFNHYRFGWGYNHYHYCYWDYCHPYRWWGWYRWFPRHVVYGAVGGAAIAAAPAMTSSAPVQQPTQPTNCLVKQYLPNGAVAFADTCTNEQAVSMPNMPNGTPQGQPGPGAR